MANASSPLLSLNSKQNQVPTSSISLGAGVEQGETIDKAIRSNMIARRKLMIATALAFIFMIAEVVGGVFAGSLVSLKFFF